MKIKRFLMAFTVLALVLLSGCEAIGGLLGIPYVFDTPVWIQGTWKDSTDPTRIWTFTPTKVTSTSSGETTDFSTYGLEIGITVSKESQPNTTSYEFYWSTLPYSFVDNEDGTLEFNEFGLFIKE